MNDVYVYVTEALNVRLVFNSNPQPKGFLRLICLQKYNLYHVGTSEFLPIELNTIELPVRRFGSVLSRSRRTTSNLNRFASND